MKKILAKTACVLMAGLLLLTGCDKGPGTPETPTDAPETAVPTEEPDLLANGCDRCDNAGNLAGFSSMQLIRDRTLTEGIRIISQKDHNNGDKTKILGTHSFYDQPASDYPLWGLCQWDSGPDLYENMVETPEKSITDGRWRTFGYDPQTDTLTFLLDTSAYYEGKPAVQGDYWPHILIECSDFGYGKKKKDEKAYFKCSADKLICSFDIKLDEYSVTPIDGDWVNAAQFLVYFYVTGTASNDFCWFGLQLFDNRWDRSEQYCSFDGGKADASGSLIYSIGSKYIYGDGPSLWKNDAPNPGGNWIHVEVDLIPYLKDMLARGEKLNYFEAKSLEKLCISGMNMGWETIGTFRTAMSVRNFKLTSYLSEERS